MPFHKDFSTFKKVLEIDVFPKKWKPLTIEYGYDHVGPLLNMFWRVKGTKHTFRIPMHQFNELSKGNYEGHFEKTLETFREDYLSWAVQSFSEEWMQEYHKDYKNFIEL